MALNWNDLTGKTNDMIVPYLTDSVYKNSPVPDAVEVEAAL
jgi:hypothetical protein